MIQEKFQKIKIENLIKQSKEQFKKDFISSQISSLGYDINLTASKTRFNGFRLWFQCPICQRRAGILYLNPLNTQLGCRLCVKAQYIKQRYKGMKEVELLDHSIISCP